MGIPLLSAEEIFQGNEGFYVHLSTDYTEYESKLHMHEFAEISHIVSGEAEHEINGARYKVHRGDVIAIKRGVPHTFRPVDCGEPFVAYDIMFTDGFLRAESGSDMQDMLSELFASRCERGDIRASGGGYQLLGDLFHRIYSEFRAKRTGYLDMIRAYVSELVVTLFRSVEESSDGRLSLKLKGAVRSTVAYLEENFRRHLTLDELAARIYFSKDYLNKVFREVTGIPVGAYLKRTRLEEAKRLLLCTDLTVSEVAEHSGFGDVKSLYTAFKSTLNITPGEYRESREMLSSVDKKNK